MGFHWSASSKNKLRRELHDPRIAERSDLSKRCGRAHGSARIVRPDVIRQIKGVRPNLQALLFPHPENPRQAHIELQCSRSQNVVRPEIPKSPQRWLHERGRIQPLDAGWRLRASGIRCERIPYHAGALAADPVHRLIQAGGHGDVAASLDAQNLRNPPIPGHHLQLLVRELRGILHRRYIHQVPPVDSRAVAAIVTPVGRVCILNAVEFRSKRIGNAV